MPDALLCMLKYEERADYASTGQVSFYEHTLLPGVRLPLSFLVEALLYHHKITPGQPMPNACLTLLEVLVEQTNITCGL